MNRSLILLAALGLASCGGDVSKDGTPANSGANAAPGLNSSVGPGPGSSDRREEGSPSHVVTDAYNRIWPLMCAYDRTCAERNLSEEACSIAVPPGAEVDQCWKVDSALLSQCEQELSGLQCESSWSNMPISCATAVTECECLDGYISEWTDDGEQVCAEPCPDGQCSGGLYCYDGACLEEQEWRCPDGWESDFVNGEEVCYEPCSESCADATLECINGFCQPPEADG